MNRVQQGIATGFLLLGALFAAPAQAAPVLYGVTGAGGAPSSLYTVDPLTGAATLIGATGFSHVTGIDFDPTTGTLYGVVSDLFNGTTALITIDPATGAGTVVGTTGNQIPDITIGPDGILRGWSECSAVPCSAADPDNPIAIDKGTGAVTLTSSSLSTQDTGVASRTATTIFVKPIGDLYSVDVNTGVATFLFGTNLSLQNLLENAPDGTLLTGARSPDGTQFYSIDVATQTATPLGASKVLFSGIAYTPVVSIPEPGTLALLGLCLGLVGLALRRPAR